jgi:hypothetical protein
MFELKPISKESLQLALERAWRYRMLNEPHEAESICLDILAVDPGHQDARVTLILALTDQFPRQRKGLLAAARAHLGKLTDEYSRLYYGGIILERTAKARFWHGGPGVGPVVYQHLREAMTLFERAAALRTAGNDEALLRWNTCARLVNEHPEIRPDEEHRQQEMLE